MEVSGQLHASAALSHRKKPPVPLDKRLSVSRVDLDAVEKRKISAPAGNRIPVCRTYKPKMRTLGCCVKQTVTFLDQLPEGKTKEK
jgi:hypothetical protein